MGKIVRKNISIDYTSMNHLIVRTCLQLIDDLITTIRCTQNLNFAQNQNNIEYSPTYKISFQSRITDRALPTNCGIISIISY